MATPNPGQFRKGPDPSRHRFTIEECQRGFWAAIYSIVTRYPDAIDTSGRHMACEFLKARARNATGSERVAARPKP